VRKQIIQRSEVVHTILVTMPIIWLLT
jgi:hypothetical protein